MRTVILLYQAGIANVFVTDADTNDANWRQSSNLTRVYQGDFHTCEAMADGAKVAGAHVSVMYWESAGDAQACSAKWEYGKGYLFVESRRRSARFYINGEV